MKTTGIKHLIIGALCSTWSLAAFGQKQYTLDECREMALRNNVAVRNAANEVEAARQGEKEAFTRYFPTVSATGMGYNADKGLLQMEMGPGMSASLLKNGIMGGVTVTQPLFAGGQIVNGNRLAAVGAEVSRVRKEQSEDEVELTVEQYYWQVVVLQEKLSTLRTVERRLESLQRDVETAVSAGVTNRNDLLQVQLRHNDLTSRRINLENNLVVCRMMLAQYVGQSTENLRLNEDYYRAGTVSMSDLLEAQSLFRQSRDQYAEAYAQFRVKRVEYLQATGR